MTAKNKLQACLLILAAAVLLLNGCASAPKRVPLPEKFSGAAGLPGYPANIHFWADVPTPHMTSWRTSSQAEIERDFSGIIDKPHAYLAISGGGENGAFGVGILTGWTATGTRPEFTLVTGISTGALIAPFAFLGPDYDDRLVEAYMTLSGAELVKPRSIFAALTTDAFADAGLKPHIARFIDQKVVDAIADAHNKGRRLYIGTANLDALRPVMWNIGAIAASGNPEAVSLIRTIMLASASLPGIFPPQYIQVTIDGKAYDEIHVDGGTCSQVFLYPLGMDLKLIGKRLRVKGKPRAYVIRNAKLAADWKPVDPPQTLSIAARATTSLIRTQGIGDLYRIFLETQRDGIDFFWTHMPDDVELESSESFTSDYMDKLIKIGQRLMTSGQAWETAPPGYAPLMD